MRSNTLTRVSNNPGAVHKAALKGHALGQSNLGAMYDKGRGVDRDYAQAVKWYRKSALKGHALGQHNLGVMYFNRNFPYQLAWVVSGPLSR